MIGYSNLVSYILYMNNLPFEQKNNKVRRWQCFVCGINLSTFEEFKNHIVEKHEEGRDYVVCPLERCGSPVRDIKLHFKAKHQSTEIPKTGTMKAIIWKDVTGVGKVKTRKPKFRDGYMISLKNNGREFHYRSAFECEFYECLEAIPEVQSYSVEPLSIPYVAPDGQLHHYFPDIFIKFTNGASEVWEIKPSSQTTLPINKAKWIAATKYCEARGWTFIVATEKGLGKLKARIRRNNALNENNG
jgi:hypothetical protein